MGQDNGMDNPLPISKEGLLAAIDTAREQLLDIRQLLVHLKNIAGSEGARDIAMNAILEIDGAIEYQNRLSDNIKEDVCTYYPPVVRT